MNAELAALLEAELVTINTDLSIQTKSAVSTVLKSLQNVFIGAGELAKNVYNSIKKYIVEIFEEMQEGNLLTIFKVIFCVTAIIGLVFVLLSGNPTIKNMAYTLGKKIGLVALWFKEKFKLTAEVVYKYTTTATERLKDSFKKSMKDVNKTMKKSIATSIDNVIFEKPVAVQWANEMPETVWGSFKLGVLNGYRKPAENNTLWGRVKANFKSALKEEADYTAQIEEEPTLFKKVVITIMFTVLIIVAIYVCKFIFDMYKSGEAAVINSGNEFYTNYSILDKLKIGIEVFYKTGKLVELDS